MTDNLAGFPCTLPDFLVEQKGLAVIAEMSLVVTFACVSCLCANISTRFAKHCFDADNLQALSIILYIGVLIPTAEETNLFHKS